GKICEVYHIVVIGDVQGDGGINSLDASIILQYDSGTGTLTGAYLIAGDVNGDSGVNSLDSSIVLQYDAEMTDISQVLLDTTVPLSVYYQYDVDFGQDSL
ncbi:MAG: dockerin type I repeat-containing protein, partial [Clostridia bacterium]|nr:dockerin type I repeat-containing protein [Clostridia bacterium]